ncbi:Uncharacterised protein [Bordetella pertussis]|nr:Uncharacterised protein [Bordetella pertussis]
MADEVAARVAVALDAVGAQADHVVAAPVAVDIVERLEIVQVGVADDEVERMVKQVGDVLADGDVARQRGQRVGVARGFEAHFGDRAHQRFAGAQAVVAAAARDDEAIGQIALVVGQQHVAELVDRRMHVHQHRVGVHERRAWIAPEQVAGIALGVVLGEVAPVDDAYRPAVGVQHRHGMQVAMLLEQPLHVVVGVARQHDRRRLDPQRQRRVARDARGLRRTGWLQRGARRRGQVGARLVLGTAQEPALRVACAQLVDRAQVVGILDALRHQGGVELARRRHHGAHQLQAALVAADAIEEVAVDLDQVGGQFGP